MEPKPKPSLSRLKRQLKAAGIAQRRVAEAAGVGEVHVCNVLAGRDASRKVVDTARRLLAEAKQPQPEAVSA